MIKITRKELIFAIIAGSMIMIILVGIVFIVFRSQLPDNPIGEKPTPQPTRVPDKAENRVALYANIPGAIASPLKMKVNGLDVFVEEYHNLHYARFAFDGNVNIELISPSPTSYQISPRSYNIHPQQEENTTRFSLNKPRHLILQAGDEKVFILADPLEKNAPKPSDKNVVNVSDYVSGADANIVQTQELQKAIDDAAARHAITYFPPGQYLSGTLRIRDGSSIYLADGAILRGSGDIQDYQEEHFLLFDKTHNARLFGRGVIDLGGKDLRLKAGDDGRVKIIRTLGAHNVEIKDVLLRDAASWTVHIVGSRDITVSNLKLINDLDTSNGDGIDPDSSRNIIVDNVFIYTSDDCFAVKTTANFNLLQPSNHIIIRNSVCYTRKSALKVGTETRANLSNILFENNNVVHADRVISLYMSDGSVLERVRYQHNFSEVVGGYSKKRLIDISINDRNGLGYIRDVDIINFTAYQAGPAKSQIKGVDGHEIDVTLSDFRIAGKVIKNLEEANIKISDAKVEIVSANRSKRT